MANVGERCRVGTDAPETGRYRHSACANTAIFNKGNNLTPCQNGQCVNRGADWILQEKLT